MRIIALANQKGGVAKTTTCHNLGAALHEMGKRVLLVDLDPQGNLTMAAGLNPNTETHTIYDVLLNPEQGAGFAVKSSREGMDIIPSTLDLAAAEQELAGKIGRETLLREALEPITQKGQYDYILIDAPPSLGLFTLNALAAVQEVIIPLQVQVFAMRGLAQLQKTIKIMQKLNPKLRVGGIVCTMVDKRNNLSFEVEAEIRQRLGNLVFKTTIPDNIRLAEAPAAGTSILKYDPTSTGAAAYRALAKEVDSHA